MVLLSVLVVLLWFLVESRRDPGWPDGLTEKVSPGMEASMPAETGKAEKADSGTPASGGALEVHFLNVGHGDSTLILCGENAMMIDCGDDTQGTKLQDYLMRQDVAELDYLVLTHPDKDHIGGAPVILTKFSVGQVLQSGYEKGSSAEEVLKQTLAHRKVDAAVPKAGAEYQLGEAWFTVLGPIGEYEESNNASIALLLHYGENTFLFTGDAEKEAEMDMLENSAKPGLDLKADVYHVGHHGGKSSSKKKFLSAVSPEFAVISCDYLGEKENPDAEVLRRLWEADVKVFRTDEQGNITAFSDGKDITWSCEPSVSWMAGNGEKMDMGLPDV